KENDPPGTRRTRYNGTVAVGLLYDPIYLDHDTGQLPENAGRLRAVVARLRDEGLWETVRHLQAEPARTEALEAVHAPEYLRCLEAVSAAGGGWLTADTLMRARSSSVAPRAA